MIWVQSDIIENGRKLNCFYIGSYLFNYPGRTPPITTKSAFDDRFGIPGPKGAYTRLKPSTLDAVTDIADGICPYTKGCDNLIRIIPIFTVSPVLHFANRLTFKEPLFRFCEHPLQTKNTFGKLLYKSCQTAFLLRAELYLYTINKFYARAFALNFYFFMQFLSNS